MKTVTPEMIQAGNQIAADLTDASISRQMGGLGGSSTFEEWQQKQDIPNQDLILQYLNDEIDSVTAIFMAMDRADPANNA